MERDVANLEDRVKALEQQMDLLSERLAMEAGLAAGRDRDLSDLAVTVRSHTAMLQAVQERQVEHTLRFDQMDARFDAVDVKLDAGLATITAMLTTLIGQGEPGEGA